MEVRKSRQSEIDRWWSDMFEDNKSERWKKEHTEVFMGTEYPDQLV